MKFADLPFTSCADQEAAEDMLDAFFAARLNLPADRINLSALSDIAPLAYGLVAAGATCDPHYIATDAERQAAIALLTDAIGAPRYTDPTSLLVQFVANLLHSLEPIADGASLDEAAIRADERKRVNADWRAKLAAL